VARLLREGATVTIHDPVVSELPASLHDSGRVSMATGLEEALGGADAVVLVTRWDDYREVPELIAALPAQPIFLDGRRMLDKEQFARYAGIGL
jgi:UDPglucose 6-dehydrogenase/GDP-mannose 6-dehydrogenase